jgi:hypothetical protein
LVDYYSTVAWGILTRPQVGDFEVAIKGIVLDGSFTPKSAELLDLTINRRES